MRRLKRQGRGKRITAVLVALASLAAAGTVLAVTGFRDLGDVHPNYDDIQFAVEQGWFQGYDDGTFRPDRVVPEHQMTRVIKRAFPDGATRADLATFMRGGHERLSKASLPGSGVRLTMAQANWATGYFQAALYRALLQELGYEVSDPADLELGPSLAYLAMAEGDADFWVNSWYPGHNSWLANELPDGSHVGDHLSKVGAAMPAGGLQGYLITKSFAEKHGIVTLDDLNGNAEAIAEYDAQDTEPGNGVAEIYGCPESWICDDIIQSQILFSGWWKNIRQVTEGYDSMFAEATRKVSRGVPTVVYTWTPSSYIAQLRPGDNVVWLGVEDVLDDSNPLGRPGGENWDQRPGAAAIGAVACPDAARRGICQLGFVAADILVTARNDLLDNHPAAAKLLEVVELNVVDVSLQVVAQEGGASPVDLAEQWIANNREKVDGWIAAALAVA